MSLCVSLSSPFNTPSDLRSSRLCRLGIPFGRLLLGSYFVAFCLWWPFALHIYPAHFNLWLLSVATILVSLKSVIISLFERISYSLSSFFFGLNILRKDFLSKTINLFLSDLVDAHEPRAYSTVGPTRILYNIIFVPLDNFFDLNNRTNEK